MDVPHNQWMSLFEGLYPVSEKVDGISIYRSSLGLQTFLVE
jgi:hypothetical protein